jgi:hypothetical protein
MTRTLYIWVIARQRVRMLADITRNIRLNARIPWAILSARG